MRLATDDEIARLHTAAPEHIMDKLQRLINETLGSEEDVAYVLLVPSERGSAIATDLTSESVRDLLGALARGGPARAEEIPKSGRN